MRTRKHVKFGRPEVGEIARYLMDKKNTILARAAAAASARIAPKICHGQVQTTYSEFPKFHPNPFTTGGVMAERVNIVQTRHKVSAILGEASASSPSKKDSSHSECTTLYVSWHMLVCSDLLYNCTKTDCMKRLAKLQYQWNKQAQSEYKHSLTFRVRAMLS